MNVEVMRSYGGFDLNYTVGCDNILMRKFLKDERKCAYIPTVIANYSDGGFSSKEENYSKNARVYAASFYNLVGKESGISVNDCEALYHCWSFEHKSVSFNLKIAQKIKIEAWRNCFLQRFQSYLDAIETRNYYMLNLPILSLKYRDYQRERYYRLFNKIPIFSVIKKGEQ
jgi:hypothetical protein